MKTLHLFLRTFFINFSPFFGVLKLFPLKCLSQTVWALGADHGDYRGPLCGPPLQRPAARQPGTTLQLQAYIFLTVATHSEFNQQGVPSRRRKPPLVSDSTCCRFCVCVCVQTTWGRWRGCVCGGPGLAGGVHHLLLHLSSLTGEDTPPLLLLLLPFFLSLVNHLTSALRLFPLDSLDSAPSCCASLAPVRVHSEPLAL